MATTRVNLFRGVQGTGRNKGRIPARKIPETQVKRRKINPKIVLFMARELKKSRHNIMDDPATRTRILEILRTQHGFSRTNAKTFLWRLFSYESINKVMAENECSRGEAIDRLMWKYFGRKYKPKNKIRK